MRNPPPELLALDGKRFDSLTSVERKLFQRFRKGRFRHGLPWISVGLTTPNLDVMAVLRAPTQAKADAILAQAGAVVCVRVYD